MPPLIQKWNELKDEDKDLFPLLEVSPPQALSRGLSIHPSSPLLPFSGTQGAWEGTLSGFQLESMA